MRKIGILGGTFNPIHIGHLLLAETVCEALKLEKIYFVPCGTPPHKTAKNLLSGQHRLAMVKKAIKGNPKFSTSDFEIRKLGKSFSIDTVNYFREKVAKNTKIYFLVGQDNALTLETWKNIDELARKVSFVAVGRSGVKKRIKSYKVKYVDMPEVNISSSEIRQRIRFKKSVKYLLSEGVIQYIKEQKLYPSLQKIYSG